MRLPQHLAAIAIALGLSSASALLFAADEQPEEVVERIVEQEAGKADDDEQPDDADVGEASYNIENCARPGEPAGDEVESEDLEDECEPVVK